MSWNGPGHGSSRDAELDLVGLARLVRRVAPYLAGLRRHLLVLAGSASGLLLLGLAAFLVLVPALWNGVLQGKPLSPVAARVLGLSLEAAVKVDSLPPELRREAASRLTWILGGFAVGMAAASMALTYYGVWILQRLNQSLRMQMVDRLQALSLRFHDQSRVGDAIYRTYQDSAMVTQVVQGFVLVPAFALLRFAVTALAVAAFSPELALWLMLLWLPVLFAGRALGPRLRSRFRAARASNSALTSQIQESLSGIRVIKAFGLEAFEQARFEKASRAAFASARSARSWVAGTGVGVFWLVGAALIAATFSATLLTREGGTLWLAGLVERLDLGRARGLLVSAGFGVWTLGMYNAWKGLYTGGADTVTQLVRTWVHAQDIAVGLDRAFELLEQEPEIRDVADAIALPRLAQGFAFRDVSFAYRPDRPALVGTSFQARVGAVTALVGPTGAGKSTVMSLLLRLFDPDAGSIELDGVDLRRFRVAELRAAIAIALQENVLFATSVRENIRYARPRAGDAEVRAAARVACADEFIEALPLGYDTPLGERGARLSTGQRQRLTLARAILKEPQILLLDEPTASLDAETEERLVSRLAEWGRGRSVLLVTHRLSTARLADRVVFLERGKVVESGAPEELLARPGGAFRALVEAEQAARGA
ncbi:MAG TPA: ABC transporter ATP-binding protein [Myxococcota bacterium]|nr:ABC transporter ATP-binding protein [Myxococcota bacterium]